MTIVLDTNILISALIFGGLSADVLDLCVLSHRIVLSDFILREIEEKLTYKIKVPTSKVKSTIGFLKDNFELLVPDTEIPDICRDIDDNNILQLAEYSNAKYIITGDQDLLVLKQYKNTVIISNREFWTLMKA